MEDAEGQPDNSSNAEEGDDLRADLVKLNPARSHSNPGEFLGTL